MAVLHFPNVIGLNGSNFDGETSHFVGVMMHKIMHPSFDRRFFCNGFIVVFSCVTTVSGTFVT